MNKFLLDGGSIQFMIDEDNEIDKTILEILQGIYNITEWPAINKNDVSGVRNPEADEVGELVAHYRQNAQVMEHKLQELTEFCEKNKAAIDADTELLKLATYAKAWIHSNCESDKNIADNLEKMAADNNLKDFFIAVHDKKPAETRQPLQALSKYGIMNDKINNKMCEIEPPLNRRSLKNSDILENGWVIDTLGGKLGGAAVSIILSYNEKDTNIKVGRILNANDFAICNAIATRFFYDRGKNDNGLLITTAEIWRTMNGIDNSRKSPTPKQAQEIENSIDKMRFTSLKIDLSAEKGAGIETPDNDFIKNAVIETYFIKASKGTFETVKGKKIDCYKIDEMPALYAYNELRKHTIYVPFEIMDVSDVITRIDNETTIIKEYLAREIQRIKTGKRNNIIVYDTIYIKNGLPIAGADLNKNDYTNEKSYNSAVRNAAKRSRKKINDILQSFKNKGFIKDFKEIKEGQKITKVKITTFEPAEIEKNK